MSWHRRAHSGQLALKLLNEGVIGRVEAPFVSLGTNLAITSGRRENTFLLLLNQINCTTKPSSGITLPISKILSWVNHQRVKTIKHVTAR